jgi:hypothetical protein
MNEQILKAGGSARVAEFLQSTCELTAARQTFLLGTC